MIPGPGQEESKRVFMQGFAGRLLLLCLLGAGALSFGLKAQEKLSGDPRLAPVSVPLPSELKASFLRARTLAAQGKVQGAVTLLLALARKDPNTLFPTGGGLYLPLSRFLDRAIPAMGKEVAAAWRERTRAGAERLLKKGLARRSREILRQAAERYPATRARREALLALADLALEGSLPWKALSYLEQASQGASPGEEARILERRAFLWAFLGKEKERNRALAELEALGKPVPFQGTPVPPSRLGGLPSFQTRPRGDAALPWRPGWAARLWIRECPPPAQKQKNRTTYTFFSFRGGTILLPGASGPLEKLDLLTPWLAFGEDRFFLRKKDGVDILETATGRLLGTIRKASMGPYAPGADPAMPSPTLAPLAMAERLPSVEGDMLYLLGPSRLSPSTNLARLRAMGVIAGRQGKQLVAFRISTGSPAWTFEISDLSPPLNRGVILSGPLACRGVVALLVRASGNFHLLGLDGESGKIRWTAFLHGAGTGYFLPPALPMAARGSTIFVPTGAGAVCAVDAGTGRILWILAYPRKDPAAPLLNAPEKWSGGWTVPSGGIPPPGFQVSRPLLLGDVLVLAPPDGDYVLGISSLDGRLLWRSSRRDPREPGRFPPAADHLVGGDENAVYLAGRKLLALETRTGRRIWEAEIPPVQGRGAVAKDSVLLPTAGGVLAVEKAPPHSTAYLKLPGRPPGPMDLYIHGPFLAGAAKDHAALWVQWRAWTARAPDPEEKARRLALSGHLDRALEIAPEEMKKKRGPAWSLDLARRFLEENQKEKALRILARAEEEAVNPLDRVSLLYLHFQVLRAAGRESRADRVFLDFLRASLEAANEEAR